MLLDGNEDVVNAYYPRECISVPTYRLPTVLTHYEFAVDWRVHVEDADEALLWFFDKCAAAGPACAINEPTAAGVKARFDAILATLTAAPIPVPGGGELTLVGLKSVVLTATYEPVYYYGMLAAGLRELELGNPAPIYEMVAKNGDGIENAVVCTDAHEVDDTPAELQAYAEEIESKSEYFSSFVASFRLFCSYVHSPLRTHAWAAH